jgi:hypothetical protein
MGVGGRCLGMDGWFGGDVGNGIPAANCNRTLAHPTGLKFRK